MGVRVQEDDSKRKRSRGSWFIMTSSIPEFRERTTSLDLPSAIHAKRLAKLSRLFRSHSDQDMKKATAIPKASSIDSSGEADSSTGSPKTVPRRRLLRVVRNQESEGLENVNPYVIRKYSQQFLEQSHSKKSIEEPTPPVEDRRLPSTVRGHTILKKYPSIDAGDHPIQQRHACFKEEVEVIEYDKRGRASARASAVVVKELLHDDEATPSQCTVASGRALQQEAHHQGNSQLPNLMLKANGTDLPIIEAPIRANS